MTQDVQVRIPAVYMRGGSSKAIFLKYDDIPPPGPLRDRVLKRLMGTPDPIQIDGMGGAKAVTSKIAILAPSTREDADVDYTFAQVGVRDDTIDYTLNCGNISAAVGPFAIDEGLVSTFLPGHPVQGGSIKTQQVRIFNTGTEKILISHVPIDEKGHPITEGACSIAAVPGTSAPIMLDYRETIGAGLNKGILPTGNVLNVTKVGDKSIAFTVCDVANVYVFAFASDFDITGHESAAILSADTRLLARVNELRGKAAQLLGMCQDWQKVDKQSPFVPMVVLIGPPPSASNITSQSHVSGRLFLDNMCHESMAGTGSMAFGACSRTKGSIVFQQVGDRTKENVLRIAHPLGVMDISVETKGTTPSEIPTFKTLSFVRTARRIMDGHVFVPKSTMEPSRLPNTVASNPDVTETSSRAAEDIPVTEIFSHFIANAKPDVLQGSLIARLKEYLIDYLGVTISAAHNWDSTDPILKGILAIGATGGSSTVVLKGKNFTPQYAGLLNATFGHSIDFDDTYAQGTLHAGVTAISAALTQTELLGTERDSKMFFLAVAIGYEVICRLGRELGNEAYARGFHNTGTAGIFGAVATICVLKELPESTIQNAFGLAVSRAAGSMQYLENGSWNKRLHPGFAVHDAFVCVALAESGVLGAKKSIEGKFGFLNGYSPKSDKDLAYLTADLGKRWTFLETALKPFPACRMTHGLIECAGKRSNQRGIEKMTVSFSAANLSVVGTRTPNKLHPDNVVDAQFSAYFQLAHSWLYGSDAGVGCYDRLNDDTIHELSEKIVCIEDSTVTRMGSKLHIEYKDGGEEQFDLPYPLGEEQNPFSKDQIEAKYFSLVTPVLGEKRASVIKTLVEGLENSSVTELLKLIG